MSQSTAIHVLIVDDHSIVRQGLAAMIENEPDMVEQHQVGKANTQRIERKHLTLRARIK
jgi:DNA-binding NarL/FixJ family response regulator